MTNYTDEIDLKPYLLALLKHWWQILILAVVMAIALFSYSNSTPEKYEASATVLINRSKLKLYLADGFSTVTEGRDIRYRTVALLVIAQSNSVAQATLESLDGQLPPAYRTYLSLLSRIEVSNEGEAIIITAKDEDPEIATLIANAWAEQTVLAINQTYSGGRPLSDIRDQIISSEQEYLDAQTTLENYIEEREIVLLEGKIALAQTILTNLTNDENWRVDYYYTRKQALEEFIQQIGSLKSQIDDGTLSEAADIGDAIAVLTTRASSFSPESYIDLHFDDIESIRDSSKNYTADLENFILLLEAEKTEAESILQELTSNALSGIVSSDLEDISTHLQNLEAQLENEKAFYKTLMTNRDLALRAYQALLQKETEILTTGPTDAEVSLVGPAIKPIRPVPSQANLLTAIGGFAGFALGVIWVLGSVWWRSMDLPVFKRKSSEN